MMSYNCKIIIFLVFFKILITGSVMAKAEEDNFEKWLVSYKKFASKKGISQETLNTAFKNVKFLDLVIQYDRKQPELFEDTITYVNKRATSIRANKAKKLLKKIIYFLTILKINFLLKRKSW